MKVTKSSRKAKQSALKPAQQPQPEKSHIDAAHYINHQIDLLKDQANGAALYAVAQHLTVLTSLPEHRLLLLDSLPYKKLLCYRISEILYSDDEAPLYAIESACRILEKAGELDEEGDTRELLGALLISILSELAQEEDTPPASRKPLQFCHQPGKQEMT